ncbi:MAG: hypothetical protein ACKVP5_12305 [Aestuariivirga sp.]
MMALAQLAGTDLIATLSRHLVKSQAVRFGFVISLVPFPWRADPMRVVASKVAVADAGIVWIFDAIIRCLGYGETKWPRKANGRIEQR